MLRQISSFYSKFVKILCTVQLGISVLALGAMVALNTFEIIRRYFWGLSIVWVQEATVLFLVWFTFMGFSMITYAKKDIYIDFIVEMFPRKVRPVVKLLIILANIVFIVLFIDCSYRLFLVQGGQTSIVARYPMRFRSAAPLINAVTLLLIYIEVLKNFFSKQPEKQTGGVEE